MSRFPLVLTKEDKDFIYHWRSRQTVASLSKALEVEVTTIHNYCKRWDFTGPGRKNEPYKGLTLNQQNFVKRWCVFQSVRNLAYALEVSPNKIYYYLNKEEVLASKRRLRRTSCKSKKAFTFDQANMVIAYYRKKDETGLDDVHMYKCPFCKKFHVGHPPTRKTE